MRKYLLPSSFLFLFGILLYFRDESLRGASEGLLLWYTTVLPTLLPFMILANLMLYTNTLTLLARCFRPVMNRFPGVSGPGAFAIAAGFLCGYPMGAKVSADLLRTRKISQREGAYLLSFCNNTSPVFILNILFLHGIPDQKLHLPFFLILITSPLLCSQLFRLYYFPNGRHLLRQPPEAEIFSDRPFRSSLAELIDRCLTDSFFAIIKVGLYMMFFGILIQIIRVFPGEPNIPRSLLSASLEITQGISILSRLTLPVFWRYTRLMALTSFGGICAVFQTSSMILNTGLSIGNYTTEKLITALVTSLLTGLYLFLYL